MPRGDKAGPPKNSTGPKDGRGRGRGNYSGKGIGKRTGGKRNNC